MATASRSDIQATFDDLSEAWKNGDGAAFADQCTDDVDFINLLGMHVKGRHAVTELHEKLFQGPYKGSTLALAIESVRPITPDIVLAIVPARVDIPSGPVAGIVSTIASILLVRNGARWKIAAFHNTRREATQADHLAIMRNAIEG